MKLPTRQPGTELWTQQGPPLCYKKTEWNQTTAGNYNRGFVCHRRQCSFGVILGWDRVERLQSGGRAPKQNHANTKLPGMRTHGNGGSEPTECAHRAGSGVGMGRRRAPARRPAFPNRTPNTHHSHSSPCLHIPLPLPLPHRCSEARSRLLKDRHDRQNSLHASPALTVPTAAAPAPFPTAPFHTAPFHTQSEGSSATDGCGRGGLGGGGNGVNGSGGDVGGGGDGCGDSTSHASTSPPLTRADPTHTYPHAQPISSRARSRPAIFGEAMPGAAVLGGTTWGAAISEEDISGAAISEDAISGPVIFKDAISGAVVFEEVGGCDGADAAPAPMTDPEVAA
eukprot:scaffold4528_cov86-Isochrysis_galbana.AAC.4